MPRIFYLNKPENLPDYKQGKELHLVHTDIGWVEYLSQDHDIYWVEGISKELYTSLHQQSLDQSKNHFHNQDFVSLGLLKNLVEYKLENEFKLPIFTGTFANNSIKVTCGLSRFFAMAVCQVDSKDIKFFLQANKNFRPTELLNYRLVTSTQQAENLSGMGSINHILSMMPTHPYHITSSVIRDSVYNKNYNEQYIFLDHGRSAMEFWEKFMSGGLIDIDIHCDNVSSSLIQFDPKIWRVNYHIAPMGNFLYSDILHKFELQEDNKLHLNLYRITEPLILDYILPLVSKDSSWYHTQNKKIHLYETTQTNNGASRPIVTWPSFVK